MTTAATDPTTSTPCGCGQGGPELPDDPYTSVNYTFGMLLGVDDFETEQGYHRGKMRLHNAWLHGAGVVWGLGVSLDSSNCQVRVDPGLALDGAGHELHLDAAACLNLGAWWEANFTDFGDTADGDAAVGDAPSPATFDAHIEASFKTCLSRQVPALASTCEGGGSETAYSRAEETIVLTLKPGLATRPAGRYHRLRVLLGLEPATADDTDVSDELSTLAGLPPDQRPAALLAAFERFAALDTIDLHPASASDAEPSPLEPTLDTDPIVLANLADIELTRDAGGGWTLGGGTVDTGVRPSHVATETIQELTCAGALALAPTGAAPTSFSAVALADTTLTLTATASLDSRTVHPEAFAVRALTSHWADISIADATYDDTTHEVTLTLDEVPAPPWRVVAFGTGPSPLLDASLKPLGGGTDFVHMEN
jgi:hypothetical protein